MSPIGIVHSCFKEKFGIPRQPGLVAEAEGQIEIIPPYDQDEAFRELESFSHIWVLFQFHATARSAWKPTVRPPRLGGNQRIGVFASRSTFRPNPIGLSVVKLNHIGRVKGKLMLSLGGIDLLEGTPVLDIKPYLPYVDAIPEAVAGYAQQSPEKIFTVQFSESAHLTCVQMERSDYPNLRQMIVSLLQLDPRPAYSSAQHSTEGDREYGMRLHDFDLKWLVTAEVIMVTQLTRIETGP
jgi:tRNA-Thr(GGU) m(6)t(6)A37 methyltransferase TsaA